MQKDESSRDLGPEKGANPGDDTTDMATEGAANASTELRKRRSTRIVQAVPLMVTGVDALGRPFAERTSTLIINCHGCRYQSKHYVLKNMWVNLEVPHPEPGHAPRRVRGKVSWGACVAKCPGFRGRERCGSCFRWRWNWKPREMRGASDSPRKIGLYFLKRRRH